MKRLSVLLLALALILALAPATALAEDYAVTLECVEGVDQSGEGWTWDGATKTFNVTDNVTLTNVPQGEGNVYCGIMLPSCSTVIIAKDKMLHIYFEREGANDYVGDRCYGIVCKGDLSIKGGKMAVNAINDVATFACINGNLTLDGLNIAGNGAGFMLTKPNASVSCNGAIMIASRLTAFLSNSSIDFAGACTMRLYTMTSPLIYARSISAGEDIAMFISDDDTFYNGLATPSALYQSATLNYDFVFGVSQKEKEYVIPEGMTLTIAPDATLYIGKSATLINKGTIVNLGSVKNKGTINQDGTFTGNEIVNEGQVLSAAASDAQDAK